MKAKETEKPRWQRLLWFVGIWGASVLALFAVATVMRHFFKFATGLE